MIPLVAAGFFSAPAATLAASVSAGSELLLGGGAINLTGSGGTLDLSNAEGIDIVSNNSMYATADGYADFNNVSFFDMGSIQDFDFTLSGGTINDFIVIGGWHFDLQSITIVTQEVGSLQLTGAGSVYGNGKDATAANWSFSTNTTGSYSTTVSVAAIPLPAAVWLFGSGLIGLAGVARRKNR